MLTSADVRRRAAEPLLHPVPARTGRLWSEMTRRRLTGLGMPSAALDTGPG
jgi:hypothetical protein